MLVIGINFSSELKEVNGNNLNTVKDIFICEDFSFA